MRLGGRLPSLFRATQLSKAAAAVPPLASRVRAMSSSSSFPSSSPSAATRATVYSSETPGPVEVQIGALIHEKIKPAKLTIFNDSSKHAHHQPMQAVEDRSETHFRLEIIADAFKTQKLTQRHRTVYDVLSKLMDPAHGGTVHALQLKTKTVEEANKASRST